MKLPSLRLLSGFEAAARLGSVSRAAEELCISQSAVSHQITQLEAQVGRPLFRRKGRGVELTMEGRVLQDSVTRSLDVIRSGLGRIETYMDTQLVTVVCPAHVVQGWLQPRLAALLADIDGICPIISIDETARYVDQMDVDLVIGRQPMRQPHLLEQAVLEDALVAVVTPAVWAAAAELVAEPAAGRPGLVCLEADLTSLAAGRFIRQNFSQFRKAAIYDDARLVLDATLRGAGIGLMSQLLASDALTRGQLMLLPGQPSLPLGKLWLSRTAGEPRSAAVRLLHEALLKAASAA